LHNCDEISPVAHIAHSDHKASQRGAVTKRNPSPNDLVHPNPPGLKENAPKGKIKAVDYER